MTLRRHYWRYKAWIHYPPGR